MLAVAERAALPPDLLAGPPDGKDAWLAQLPGPLLDEYIAATAEPPRPEPLPAGLWSRETGDGAGFAAGGVGDRLAPGPVLAGLVDDARAGGLGTLSDDELIGVLRAGRRLASWAASIELAVAGDLMRRRLDQDAAGQTGAAEHADAEVAAALTLTGRAAGRLLDLALVLQRLPRTARALAAGVIDVPRAMAIADEVAGLAEEHVAGVEEPVLARAAGQTTTQVRAAARRAAIAADASAVRKRREQAQREARMERWAEQAGTAALVGRDLPPAGTLAADQHLTDLQHLIGVRQQLCMFPGCGRAARRCDLDHTIPYHRGGRTCECNMAPLCRKHHQAKQAQGWWLEQAQPGIMTWTTPSGRRYTTHPTVYPE
jgi:hypothetical protein